MDTVINDMELRNLLSVTIKGLWELHAAEPVTGFTPEAFADEVIKVIRPFMVRGNPNYYQEAKELALENFKMKKKIAADEEALRQCIDTDIQVSDAFAFIAEQKRQLRTACGMFLNGMAYYSKFSDNKKDAAYLQKQATYWFLYARAAIPEDMHGQYMEMAKAVAQRADPTVCRTKE